MAYDFRLLHVEVDGGVARATIDNPPINLMTVELFLELATFADEVAADDSVRVVVLRSAVDGYFIAHFDIEALLAIPTDGEAERPAELNRFHAMCERLRTMPKPTIACIAGRVGGGGSELAASCDMRFGALGATAVNQMEVAAGIIPGGTGTVRLPRLVGRGRALEIVLGCDDLDAETAERWGYLNRALPPDELEPFVDRLALRIAAFPPHAVAAAKRSVAAADGDLTDALLDEAHLFERTRRHPEGMAAMRRLLDAGAQTPDGEARMGDLCADANPPPT